jgi:hypothetical protein
LDLETQKLELEVDKLRRDRDSGELPKWLIGVLGLLGGAISATAAVWIARRTRRGALDQSVHDKRLESYPKLVEATARLALFFPRFDPLDSSGDQPEACVGREDCTAMGRAMSAWYFGGGGLLLTVEARDAYFRLAEALTLASEENKLKLKVPIFPKDAKHISREKVDMYRKRLATKFKLDDIENWRFGDSDSGNDNLATRLKSYIFVQRVSRKFQAKLKEEYDLAVRFKDYIFLQRLSSKLRTTLTKDLQSRRPPK